MAAEEFAGDSRTEAQWIGDVGWATLNRLDAVRAELANLARQFEMLCDWCDRQGMASAAYALEVSANDAKRLGNPNDAAALVRSVIAQTGRERQPYHEKR